MVIMLNTTTKSSNNADEDQQQKLLVNIISAVYGIISLGFFSNVAVAVVVGNILIRLGRHLPNRHMLVYVTALCIVDALVLGTLPMLITQLYLQRWIFGQTLCTVYWTIESINKTLSTFILTCLSFDRYLAVRFPQRCLHIRTVRGAMYILFSCIVFAALLLMPVYLHAEVTEVAVGLDSDDQTGNVTVTTVSTCAFVGQSSFLFTIFTLCYLVPFACMSCFYGSMLARLRHKSRKLGLRQGRVRRVTKKTLTLVVLYFVFWTPYWVMTLRSVVSDAISEAFNGKVATGLVAGLSTNNATRNWTTTLRSVPPTSTTTTAVITAGLSTVASAVGGGETENEDGGGDALSAVTFAIMCAIHSGCYLNSAINPILYALLNRELRRQHSAAMNHSGGPRSSIPVSLNGTGNGTRSSVGGLAQAAAQRQPLILCSSLDGGGVQQTKWDEASTATPSSGRSLARKYPHAVGGVKGRRKSGFWRIWSRHSASTFSSSTTSGSNGTRRDVTVFEPPRPSNGFFDRLIGIGTTSRRGLRGRSMSSPATAADSVSITGHSANML